MIKDYFKFAVGSLFHRKLRSWLTLLGIFIGIAAVVALISLGQGMQHSITDQFKTLGADRVIVYPGGMAGPPGSETSLAKLTKDDVDVVKKSKGVKKAAGLFTQTLKVEKDRDFLYSMVFGIPTGKEGELFMMTGRYDAEKGRTIKEGDKFKAVVGPQLTKENGPFKKPLALGGIIKINGYDFTVIGIGKSLGNSISDSQIITTEEALREITSNPNEVSMIHAIASDGFKPDAVAENIKKDLRKSRNLEKGKEDFEVTTAQQLINTVNSILIIVQGIIIGIAAISLLVGGIGIMNTMYTSVLERTREIGVMKAIGAKNSSILLIFLIEAGLLGAVGGVIGAVFGMGLAKMVEIIGTYIWGTALLKANFSFWLIGGAILFAFIIGSVSGTLPAIQASKLKPVDALRYE